MIDRERLISWLHDRANARSALVGAVYAGLADRIERGDFDNNREGND